MKKGIESKAEVEKEVMEEKPPFDEIYCMNEIRKMLRRQWAELDYFIKCKNKQSNTTWKQQK